MIPRVLHRIWVGDPMPAHLQAYGQTWVAHHPGWVHRLWGQDDLPVLYNQELYDNATELAPGHEGQFRADIARLELLWIYGGVYVDCDFECRRPIDDLCDVAAFAAWEQEGVWVNNAIFGCTPGHPFLRRLIDGLAANVMTHRGARPNVMSGPQYLTRQWRSGEHTDLVVYPQAWFYPYSWNELHRRDEDFPDAYAVHHWNNKRRRAGPTGVPGRPDHG